MLHGPTSLQQHLDEDTVLASTKSCSERKAETCDTLLVVEHRAPFRVLDMGAEWTRLLGFVSACNVTGRSLHVISGPKTDMATTTALVEDAKASNKPEVAKRITVYTRSGDPMQVCVVSSRRGKTVELRLTQSQDASPMPDTKLEQTMQATFMMHEPHQMCSGTPAFYDLYQFHQYALNNTNDFQPLATTDNQIFLSNIFGWRTDGQRFKNMIKRASKGSNVTSVVYTYTSHGNELKTRLTIAPHPGQSDRLSLTVELESVPCSSGDTEQHLSGDSAASVESILFEERSYLGSILPSGHRISRTDHGGKCAYKAMQAYKARKKLEDASQAQVVQNLRLLLDKDERCL